MPSWERKLLSEGKAPDPRFTLANERTFLAWIRTALALVAGGLACAQFLPPLGVAHLREGIALYVYMVNTNIFMRILT